ncbi:MAG: hypothetical protein AB7O37_24000 [Vicinamibacteria bacterium]
MPAAKPMSPGQRARYYSGLIREAEEKGLQLREVEAAHGLKPGRLSRWRYEQNGRRRKKEAAASAKPAKPKVASRKAEESSPTFVPVKVVQPAEPAAPSIRQGYEVALANGRTLRVPADFDGARVTALVAALESAC